MTHKNKFSVHKQNGYTIILIPNENNTVHISACINSGTNNETKTNSGIHHLVEHILTEAWKPCGKETCNSYWDKKGVTMNASTNMSFVKFYVNGLKEDFDIMMQYMIDIITIPLLKESTLKIEKHAVLNELLILKNDSEHKLIDAFNKEFFCNEGLKYDGDFDVQTKNLEKMNMKKINDFYNNINKEIIFVISGAGIDKNIFNKFKFNKFDKLTYYFIKEKEIFTYSNKIIHIYHNIKSTIFMMGIPVKGVSYKMSACLSVLHSILFQKLRVEMKMIYGIRVELINLPKQFILIKGTVENKHLVIVYKTILSIMERYKNEPFPVSYVKGMKKSYKLSYYNNSYTSSFFANYYLRQYLNGTMISLHKKYMDIQKMDVKMMDFNDILFVYMGKNIMK